VLDGDKLEPNYTLADKFIAKWLNEANRTFELSKLQLNKRKTELSNSVHPILLAYRDDFRTFFAKTT